MRHAKSDWANEGLSDHDRPLNARGRRDAPQMAMWLADQDAVPDLILASTAKRVEETIALMMPRWQSQPTVIRSQSLYLASPQTILEHIRNDAVNEQGRRPKRLLVLGHNPGMEYLVSSLAGASHMMPTAAVAVFECEAISPEDESAPRVKQLVALGRPKEI